MPPSTIAQNAVLALFVFTALSVVFAWIAWRAGQLAGARALIPIWAASALLCAGLMAVQIVRQQAALGFASAPRSWVSPFTLFLPMWAAGLGAVALVVRSRIRTGELRFSAGTALRSAGAFLAGCLAYFVVYAAADFGRILLRP